MRSMYRVYGVGFIRFSDGGLERLWQDLPRFASGTIGCYRFLCRFSRRVLSTPLLVFGQSYVVASIYYRSYYHYYITIMMVILIVITTVFGA